MSKSKILSELPDKADDIDEAIDKSHDQNTDTMLNEGGANEISAETINDTFANHESDIDDIESDILGIFQDIGNAEDRLDVVEGDVEDLKDNFETDLTISLDFHNDRIVVSENSPMQITRAGSLWMVNFDFTVIENNGGGNVNWMTGITGLTTSMFVGQCALIGSSENKTAYITIGNQDVLGDGVCLFYVAGEDGFAQTTSPFFAENNRIRGQLMFRRDL